MKEEKKKEKSESKKKHKNPTNKRIWIHPKSKSARKNLL